MLQEAKDLNVVCEIEALGDQSVDRDSLTRRGTLELAWAYFKVSRLRVPRRIFELVKSLAKAHAEKARTVETLAD